MVKLARYKNILYMNKPTGLIIFVFFVVVFILYTILWWGILERREYFSYIAGRESEHKRTMLMYPVIDMGFNKNFCVDGKLDVHEVKQRDATFISVRKHEVK